MSSVGIPGMPLIYQYVCALGLLIIGMALLLKGGKWWGLIPVAGAAYWAYMISLPYFK